MKHSTHECSLLKGTSSEEQIMEEGSKQKGNCTVENYEYITSAMWSK